MKIKKIYLVAFMVLFFLCLPKTYADYIDSSFSPENHGLGYFNSKYQFSKNYSNTYNHISVIKKEGGQHVFCTNRYKNFAFSDSYVKDTKYKNVLCRYKEKQGNEWISKYGGDCSVLMGYIIYSAYDQASKSCPKGYGIEFCKNMHAQAVVWVQLRQFTYDNGGSSYLQEYNSYQETYDAYTKNQDVQEIFKRAWTKYVEDEKNRTIYENVNNLYHVEVEDGDNNFYYIPDKDSCGSNGGYYRTKKITVYNDSTKKLDFTISTQNPGYVIIVDGDSKEYKQEYKTQIGTDNGNNKLVFYLKTSQFIGAESENQAKAILHYRGEVSGETSTAEYASYDSERWTLSGWQGLIKATTTTSQKTVGKISYQESTGSYIQDRLEFNIVKDTPSNKSEIVCANKATNYEEINGDTKESICKIISLGGESRVRVIITESVNFQYGYLYPSKYSSTNLVKSVYSGGSFNLNKATTLGATTNYKVGVKWEFADWNRYTNLPYYYDENLKDNNANNVKDTVNENLEKEIQEKYKNLALTIDTYDSNVLEDNGGSKVGKEFTFPLKITQNNNSEISTIEFNDSNKLELTLNNIELNKYKFKDEVNGTIEYCEESDINCTNRGYFVPMYYPTGDFKFNISESDLSIVEGIELKYSAICEIPVVNKFNTNYLRYRTITLDKPFPKANTKTGEGIPENWKPWYVGNEINQRRIKETYINGIIYSINLDSEKSKKIDKINQESYYTDWKNMKVTGDSTVITTDGLFDITNTKKSYCGLGIFKPECDRY